MNEFQQKVNYWRRWWRWPRSSSRTAWRLLKMWVQGPPDSKVVHGRKGYFRNSKMSGQYRSSGTPVMLLESLNTILVHSKNTQGSETGKGKLSYGHHWFWEKHYGQNKGLCQCIKPNIALQSKQNSTSYVLKVLKNQNEKEGRIPDWRVGPKGMPAPVIS